MHAGRAPCVDQLCVSDCAETEPISIAIGVVQPIDFFIVSRVAKLPRRGRIDPVVYARWKHN